MGVVLHLSLLPVTGLSWWSPVGARPPAPLSRRALAASGVSQWWSVFGADLVAPMPFGRISDRTLRRDGQHDSCHVWD